MLRSDDSRNSCDVMSLKKRKTSESVYDVVFSPILKRYSIDERAEIVERLPFASRFPLRRLRVGAFFRERKDPYEIKEICCEVDILLTCVHNRCAFNKINRSIRL